MPALYEPIRFQNAKIILSKVAYMDRYTSISALSALSKRPPTDKEYKYYNTCKLLILPESIKFDVHLTIVHTQLHRYHHTTTWLMSTRPLSNLICPERMVLKPILSILSLARCFCTRSLVELGKTKRFEFAKAKANLDAKKTSGGELKANLTQFFLKTFPVLTKQVFFV